MPPTTALYTTHNDTRWWSICSAELTDILRDTYYNIGDDLGMSYLHIYTQYLWSRGEMVFLLGKINLDTIQLIRICKSNKIIVCLYVTKRHLMKVHTNIIVTTGNYTILYAVYTIPDISWC